MWLPRSNVKHIHLDGLIEINSCLDEWYLNIDIGEDDIGIIGNYGMGDIGKATLAGVFF